MDIVNNPKVALQQISLIILEDDIEYQQNIIDSLTPRLDEFFEWYLAIDIQEATAILEKVWDRQIRPFILADLWNENKKVLENFGWVLNHQDRFSEVFILSGVLDSETRKFLIDRGIPSKFIFDKLDEWAENLWIELENSRSRHILSMERPKYQSEMIPDSIAIIETDIEGINTDLEPITMKARHEPYILRVGITSTPYLENVNPWLVGKDLTVSIFVLNSEIFSNVSSLTIPPADSFNYCRLKLPLERVENKEERDLLIFVHLEDYLLLSRQIRMRVI